MNLNGFVSIVMAIAYLTACASSADSPLKPQGFEKKPATRMLEAGSWVLQTDSPLEPMTVYLDGFHASKDHPEHQMEAHHFCHQVNEDFAQCALFDGNARKANLVGIEYIISETLFNTLPEEERGFWHPHNFEILSGQLIAPGLPEAAEMQLMKSKLNSYGKTWRLWNTGSFGKPGDSLPLGKPVLEWSFNQEGEIMPGLIERRDRQFNLSTEEKRQSRAGLQSLARPQSGRAAYKTGQ